MSAGGPSSVPSRSELSLRTPLTIAVVALAAIAGYGGFRAAAGLDLGAEAGAGIVALAAVTGFAVFFSPCSFPMVLALLAGSDRPSDTGRRRRDAVVTALSMGAGAAVFLLLTGVVVGIAGEGLAQSIGFDTVGGRILRGSVATILVIAGVVQLGFISVPFSRFARFAQPIDRRRAQLSARHPHGAHMLYGFGFILAGFG